MKTRSLPILSFTDARTHGGRLLVALLGVTLACLGCGCRLLQTAVDVPAQTVRAVTPGQKDKGQADPVEIQQKLLRFADDFSTRTGIGVDKLQTGSNALTRAEVLQSKIALVTENCSIVSGPNAIANLLDMTVFVTVTRMALEEYWLPKIFGEPARPLLEICSSAEKEIWLLAGKVLKEEQQAELHAAIAQWRRENPLPESVLAARAVSFTSGMAKERNATTARVDSVFSLLNVDPLSGMEPAVREIAQTRLFAERTLFVTQKMPTLLRWQMELLSLNVTTIPSVQQLVTNSTQISTSVERFAAAAEKLPGQISAERAEILKALEAQEKNLTPLVNEVRHTLAAGSQMSTSLNTTLATFDALMKRFGVGETNNATPPDTNAAPFRIQDYGQAAGQFEQMARQLTELLLAVEETTGSNNLSRISTQLTPVVQQAQTSGKEIVDYAFWRAILLVVFALVAAVIYRLLSSRLHPSSRSKPNSP